MNHKILDNITDVITTYEVGLSTHLISKGLKIAAFIDNNGYSGEFSPYYYCVDYHIINGIPLIKKKILFSTYRKDELFTLARMNFNISKKYYIDLIQKNNKKLIIDFDKLALEKEIKQLNIFSVIKHLVISTLVKVKKIFKN